MACGTAKRVFDIAVSGLGVILLAPLFAVLAFAIKLDSRGPALFRQQRVGRHFQLFEILKFRTMTVDRTEDGPKITVGGDPRITRVGRVLRQTKLDELPQLVNVLKGEMSLVGPRPEVPEYVQMFRPEYLKILEVRPGITDPASVQFRGEEELLAASSDPVGLYVSRILPRKLQLGEAYAAAPPNVFRDLVVIGRTLLAVFRGHRSTGTS